MDATSPQHHPLIFVALSLVVAILGSWTALDLFRRVRSHLGRGRQAWLVTSAVAMGLSTWSMHFIAMLGFQPGVPVVYDPVLTLASLALAIAATGGAFFLAARGRVRRLHLVAAGAAMGAGICLMHYVGMAAMRSDLVMRYDPRFVIASLVIAVTASTAALFVARREQSLAWRAVAAVALGLAVAGMHYTAMAGLMLTPLPGAQSMPAGASAYILAVSVAGGALLMLFLALVASLYDQRGNVLSALEAGGVGYWELDWSSKALRLSPRARQILGLPPHGEPDYAQLVALVHPEDVEQHARMLKATLTTGAEYDAEYRLAREARWVNVRGRVIDRASGGQRVSGVILDVTERHEAFAAIAESERRQRLLIDELNHRVKNTLATVQSIAMQTAKRSPTLAAFRESFEGRLAALSSTHDALTSGGWELASLRELLQRELGPFPLDQVRLQGTDLKIGPRPALSLGMVFHELATNAAKFGALSVPTGRVDVAWTMRGDPDQTLVIDWTESGGPPVAAPADPGFGSRLIVRSIGHDLNGRAELDYAPKGLRCRITLPFAAPRVIDRSVARFTF